MLINWKSRVMHKMAAMRHENNYISVHQLDQSHGKIQDFCSGGIAMKRI